MTISRRLRGFAIAAVAIVFVTGLQPTGFDRAGAAENGAAACKKGEAAGYPCKGIDLQSFLPSADLGGARIADVWGWADPETKKEYALLGSTRG
ncbi:MAG: hypothetical protein ACRDLB_07280, partial [Actinomycetota bacterium]